MMQRMSDAMDAAAVIDSFGGGGGGGGGGAVSMQHDLNGTGTESSTGVAAAAATAGSGGGGGSGSAAAAAAVDSPYHLFTVRQNLVVVSFRRGRNSKNPYFAVREFDTKVLRASSKSAAAGGGGGGGSGGLKKSSSSGGGPSEQAMRASIRQTVLNLKLGHERASKAEIQLLKHRGVLGKRAPSCSLLCGSDMILLLKEFGKVTTAEDLSKALKKHAADPKSVAQPLTVDAAKLSAGGGDSGSDDGDSDDSDGGQRKRKPAPVRRTNSKPQRPSTAGSIASAGGDAYGTGSVRASGRVTRLPSALAESSLSGAMRKRKSSQSQHFTTGYDGSILSSALPLPVVPGMDSHSLDDSHAHAQAADNFAQLQHYASMAYAGAGGGGGGYAPIPVVPVDGSASEDGGSAAASNKENASADGLHLFGPLSSDEQHLYQSATDLRRRSSNPVLPLRDNTRLNARNGSGGGVLPLPLPLPLPHPHHQQHHPMYPSMHHTSSGVSNGYSYAPVPPVTSNGYGYVPQHHHMSLPPPLPMHHHHHMQSVQAMHQHHQQLQHHQHHLQQQRKLSPTHSNTISHTGSVGGGGSGHSPPLLVASSGTSTAAVLSDGLPTPAILVPTQQTATTNGISVLDSLSLGISPRAVRPPTGTGSGASVLMNGSTTSGSGTNAFGALLAACSVPGMTRTNSASNLNGLSSNGTGASANGTAIAGNGSGSAAVVEYALHKRRRVSSSTPTAIAGAGAAGSAGSDVPSPSAAAGGGSAGASPRSFSPPGATSNAGTGSAVGSGVSSLSITLAASAAVVAAAASRAPSPSAALSLPSSISMLSPTFSRSQSSIGSLYSNPQPVGTSASQQATVSTPAPLSHSSQQQQSGVASSTLQPMHSLVAPSPMALHTTSTTASTATTNTSSNTLTNGVATGTASAAPQPQPSTPHFGAVHPPPVMATPTPLNSTPGPSAAFLLSPPIHSHMLVTSTHTQLPSHLLRSTSLHHHYNAHHSSNTNHLLNSSSKHTALMTATPTAASAHNGQTQTPSTANGAGATSNGGSPPLTATPAPTHALPSAPHTASAVKSESLTPPHVRTHSVFASTPSHLTSTHNPSIPYVSPSSYVACSPRAPGVTSNGGAERVGGPGATTPAPLSVPSRSVLMSGGGGAVSPSPFLASPPFSRVAAMQMHTAADVEPSPPQTHKFAVRH